MDDGLTPGAAQVADLARAEPPYRSLRPYARTVTLFVIAGGAIMVFRAVVGFALWRWFAGATPGAEVDIPTVAVAARWLTRSQVAVLPEVFIRLGGFIALLAWMYAAARNLRAFGETGLRHSPARTVVWFFVPVANLVFPYLAVREIWQRSMRSRWFHGDADAPAVATWWIAWLGTLIADRAVAFARGDSAVPGVLIRDTVRAAGAEAGNLVAAILTIYIVREVTARQEARRAEATPAARFRAASPIAP